LCDYTFSVLVGYKALHSPHTLGMWWYENRYRVFFIKLGFSVVFTSLFYHTLKSFGFYVFTIASADTHIRSASRWTFVCALWVTLM